MYPVSLKISGFKSFADSTEIVFSEGLSAVVGPNGCGKSNVVEALRWVMGENSARRLRGTEMDDVVFAGSGERPPFSRAEVSLTLDNPAASSTSHTTSHTASHTTSFDSPLPRASNTDTNTDTDAQAEQEPTPERTSSPSDNEGGSLLARLRNQPRVVLSRRIETGGGSSYRINGKEALARDVQTLCADIGLGANASGIVGQGQVATLVEAKPSERRLLLEQAAGVRGLYARRSEALGMMDNTRTTLERVDDRVREIEKQRKTLSADDARAERYRNLSRQIQRWQAADLAREEEALTREERSIESARQTREKELAEGRAAIATLEAQMQEEIAKQSEAETQTRESGARCQSIDQDVILLERSRKDNAERKKTLITRQVEQKRLRDEQQRALEDVEKMWQSASLRLQGTHEQHPAQRQEGLTETQRKKALAALAQEDVTLERDLKKAAQALSECDRDGAVYAERLASSRSQKERLEKEIANLHKKLQGEASETNLKKLGEEMRLAEAQAQEMQRKTLPRLRKEEETLSQERERYEERHRTLMLSRVAERDKNRDLYREASLAQTNSETQEDEKQGKKQDGERGEMQAAPLLVDWQPPEELSLALFGALGEDLFATLERGKDDTSFKNAFKAAPKATLKATIAAWRRWREMPRGEGDLAPLPVGVASLADSLADILADKFNEVPVALRARLACVGLVADKREGEALQGALSCGQRLVARDGSCWRWDGLTHDAALAVATSTRFRAFLQHERRKEDWERSEAALRLAEREYETKSSEHSRALAAMRERMQTAVEEQTRLSRELQTLGKRLRSAEAQARATEGYQARQTQLTFGLDGARAQERLAEQALQGLATRERWVEEQAQLSARREALRAEQNALLAQRQREQDSETRVHEERRRRVEDEQRLRALKERHSGLLEGSVESLRALEAETSKLEELPQREQQALAEKHDLLERAREELRTRTSALEQASAQVAQLRDRHRALTAKNAEVERDTVRLQTQAEPLPQVRERLKVRVLENLDCTLAGLRERFELDADFLAENADLQTAARRSAQDKRARLGEINFTARQALQGLTEEFEQTQRQHDDITQALEKLHHSIATLEQEAADKLVHVQQEAGACFAGFIRRLFGGGDAQLFFSEPDDPISSGLEIRLSLPGKRIKSLSAMSGGEQALVAIALILAVFAVVGGGFCILDEVDAALDDTNVSRFCDLIEDIAQQHHTRFLLITHHRHTMSRALKLYGVAMPEPGCSRIVSVALDEAVEQARPAAE